MAGNGVSIFRNRLGLTRGERWVVGLLGAAALLTALAASVARWQLERRRRALAAAVDEERGVLGARARTLVLAMDDVILEAAATPWPGDLAAPELASPEARDALFRLHALFVRAALPEVARLDAIGAAVRRSEKDAFALCLVRPPDGPSPEDLRAAATRFWLGGALFEDATHHVLPLSAVHRGLRPLSRAFAEELAHADGHLDVRRLEEEYDARPPNALALARAAASFVLLVAVVDELPPGMPEPEVGRSLTASRRPAILPRIEDQPHHVRAVVWSADAQRILLRSRTWVDVASGGDPGPRLRGAAAEVHACQAAVALRGGARPSSAPAASAAPP